MIAFLVRLHFYLIYQLKFYKIIVHCHSLSNCRLHVASDLLLDRMWRFSYLRDFNFENCPILKLKVR